MCISGGNSSGSLTPANKTLLHTIRNKIKHQIEKISIEIVKTIVNNSILNSVSIKRESKQDLVFSVKLQL